MTIDFKRYETFVDAVTSDASKDFVNLSLTAWLSWMDRVRTLKSF